jgi:NAD(P)-dependent dehydrogenase (short-subunit alcohol dehydrogenase family)
VIRSVIVTGAGRGIGREIASQCAISGSRVVGVDTSFGGKDSFSTRIEGDVRDREVASAAFDEASRDGAIVSLVTAAGVTFPEEGGYSTESWDTTISVNLSAVFGWVEQFRNLVVAGVMTGSSVVTIASLSAHRAFANNPAYVASKTGVLGLTRAFALELAPYGVRVNSVSPGYIRTEMTTTSWSDPELRAQRAESSMLGRWGEPIDVALVCKFLLSDDARFVTGVDIPVDGGWLAKS